MVTLVIAVVELLAVNNTLTCRICRNSHIGHCGSVVHDSGHIVAVRKSHSDKSYSWQIFFYLCHRPAHILMLFFHIITCPCTFNSKNWNLTMLNNHVEILHQYAHANTRETSSKKGLHVLNAWSLTTIHVPNNMLMFANVNAFSKLSITL